MSRSGPQLALLSALLFGLSPVASKLLLREMSPVLFAGVLYLGSGLALFAWSRFRVHGGIAALSSLDRISRLKLIGAIVCGGVIAPAMMIYGIRLSSSFEVSLLLNFETVATTLIAWLVFREHIGGRVWLGKGLIVAGALLLGLQMQSGVHLSRGALFLLGACLFWGVDNNLTRDVEDIPAPYLAAVKGLAAGVFNVSLGFFLGQGRINLSQVFLVSLVGVFSYGISLVLFVEALRLIGASRASTYFASAPFVGVILSLLVLGERPPFLHWVAAVSMVFGVLDLYREKHSHRHTHAPLTHKHQHRHDEHHQHTHDGSEGPEPHEHLHTHEVLAHSHPHYPDIHHRHEH